MRYKQVRTVDGVQTTSLYISKIFEVEESADQTTYKYYIGDIVNDYEDAGSDIRFTHRDRLGSTVTMTDHNNT